MRRSWLAAARGKLLDVLLAAVTLGLLMGLVTLGVPGTAALFTADYPDSVTIAAGNIFPDERDTPAFSVSDHSSGTGVDASSPIAYAGDGRASTTSGWPASFDSSRYVELRFNRPLPGNVALTSASFDLDWSSVAGTVCIYLETRDSTGSPLESQGDADDPLACTASTSPVGLVTPLTALVGPDVANAARVRILAASSGAAGMTIDRAVLKVVYGGEQFTLYATDLIDVADGSPSTDHWGLAGS